MNDAGINGFNTIDTMGRIGLWPIPHEPKEANTMIPLWILRHFIVIGRSFQARRRSNNPKMIP